MLTRRSANGIGVLGVTGLMFGALIFEHVLKLAPCNMCMLQRGATLCLGAVFLLAFVHDPGRLIARAYALLVLLAAAALVALSARHVWMQMQPKGSLASCGADFWTMMGMLPLTEVISRIVNGGGDCQEIGWSLFGLSIPGWLGLAGVALGGLGVWGNLCLQRSGGRA